MSFLLKGSVWSLSMANVRQREERKAVGWFLPVGGFTTKRWFGFETARQALAPVSVQVVPRRGSFFGTEWPMARVITFFPKQVYMGNDGTTPGNYSDIFEITEEGRLDIEMRMFAAVPYTQQVTGTIFTTSDETFVDAAWKTVGTLGRTGTGIVTSTGLSGLGRFVRATLWVSVSPQKPKVTHPLTWTQRQGDPERTIQSMRGLRNRITFKAG